MSHPLNLLQDLLLTLFLALGCAWFAIDLARKLRAPQSAEAPAPTPSAPVPASRPEPAAVATPAAPPAPAPAVAITPAAAPAPVPSAPVAAAESPASDLPATHLAAITAAVHHLFKGRARLASVFAASPAGSHSSVDWAREGRRDIFTSHRLR